MAKNKKYQSKKHTFKQTQPEPAVNVAAGQTAAVLKASRTTVLPGIVTSRDLSYVGPEMRRVALLSVILLAFELALWIVLDFTAFGQTLYGLVRF